MLKILTNVSKYKKISKVLSYKSRVFNNTFRVHRRAMKRETGFRCFLVRAAVAAGD